MGHGSDFDGSSVVSSDCIYSTETNRTNQGLLLGQQENAMWIFGYDESKRVFEVDVPDETIIAMQIDPWRLDLFDADPVICNCGKNMELRFSRLRPVAFGYFGDRKIMLCVHYGAESICLEADSCDTTDDRLRIFNPSPSKDSFNEHLRRFLKLTWYHNKLVFPPRDPAAVKITGSTVFLDKDPAPIPDDMQGNPLFTGEMFRMLSLPVTLPENINWLFRTFGHLNPIVDGHRFQQCVAGLDYDAQIMHVEQSEMPGLYDYLVNHEKELGVTNISQMMDEHMCFTQNGSRYGVCGTSMKEERERISTPQPNVGSTVMSSDGIYATGVNQLAASRIALFDIPRRRSRAVSLWGQRFYWTMTGDDARFAGPQGFSLESPVYGNPNYQRTRSGFLVNKDRPVDLTTRIRALAALAA